MLLMGGTLATAQIRCQSALIAWDSERATSCVNVLLDGV
jgi:hypothetical protein